MLRKITAVLLLTIVIVFCNSCAKEYSCESCKGALADKGLIVVASLQNTVNGNYIEGTELDASNYLTLYVNVKTPGDYTINTDDTDGISFSGDFSFAQKGFYTLTLYGHGTPATSGHLTITISSGGGTAIYPIDVKSISCAPSNSFVEAGNPVVNFTSIVGSQYNGVANRIDYLVEALTQGHQVSLNFFGDQKPVAGVYTINANPLTLKKGEVYVRYVNLNGVWNAQSGEVTVYEKNGDTYFTFCDTRFTRDDLNLTASLNIRY